MDQSNNQNQQKSLVDKEGNKSLVSKKSGQSLNNKVDEKSLDYKVDEKSLDYKVGEKLNQARDWTKSNKTLTFIFITSAFLASVIIFTTSEVNWIGFGKDSNKSITVEKELNPTYKEEEFKTEQGATEKGNVIKRVVKVTNNEQSFKTLWDWLQLVGVLAIPLALYYFQRSEHRRSEDRNKLEQKRLEDRNDLERKQLEYQKNFERKEAGNIQREDALETYINQISQVVLDTKLLVKIQSFIVDFVGLNNDDVKKDVKQLVKDSSNPLKTIKNNREIYSQIIKQLNTEPEIFVVFDIIRARTLSILRKLDKDGKRKGEIIRFLIDMELIDKVDFNSADLTGADLYHADLSGADLSGADLSGAHLEGAKLEGANLYNANLYRAKLEGAKLEGANLYHANLYHANLDGAKLSDANLSYADLSGADPYHADLSGADLSGANLSGAELSDADLSGAKLEGADLKGAFLSGALLKNPSFSRLFLKKTNLSDVNLDGAKLTNITWNKHTNWKDVQGFDKARDVPKDLIEPKS